MRNIVILALLLFLLIFEAESQTGNAQPGQPVEQSVRIKVDGAKELTILLPEFKKLPRVTLKVKDHQGAEAEYSGVELRELLTAAGAKLGSELRGKNLAFYVVVTARDDYKGVFGIAEVDTGFRDQRIILADQKNGKALSEDAGPFQVIVEGDKRHGRFVRQVKEIFVRRVE